MKMTERSRGGWRRGGPGCRHLSSKAIVAVIAPTKMAAIARRLFDERRRRALWARIAIANPIPVQAARDTVACEILSQTGMATLAQHSLVWLTRERASQSQSKM